MNQSFEPIQVDPKQPATSESKVPVIKVDDSRSRTGKKPKAKPHAARTPAKAAFDATALSRLVGAESPATDTPADPPTSSPAERPADSSAVTPIESTANASQSAEDSVIQPSPTPPASTDEDKELSKRAPAAALEVATTAERLADAAAPSAASQPAAVKIQTTKPGAKIPETGKRDSIKVQPTSSANATAGPTRTAKLTARKAAAGGAGFKRIPTPWIVLGVCGGSALGLAILLFSLLGGSSADSPTNRSRTGERSAIAPVTGPRALPTFQSDLPTDRYGGGVRPMDAAEQARRRERIASFAEMGREQESELREEKPQRKP